MRIDTKYNIGDMIEFQRTIKYVGDKVKLEPKEVGIIESILIEEYEYSYLVKSSYQSYINDADILNKLGAI